MADRVLRVFLASVIVFASTVAGLLSVIVVLEGLEDERTVTLGSYAVAAETAGVLGLLISGAGVVGAAWLVRAYGHPRLPKSRDIAKPS